MKYEDSFYGEYRKYVETPSVRDAHGKVLRIFRKMVNMKIPRPSFVDLGCGTAEFAKYMHETMWDDPYYGFDLNIDHVYIAKPHSNFTVLDFNLFTARHGDVFVSLFATELMLSIEDREKLYAKLFSQGAKMGLVVGFYYNHARLNWKVQETTGMTVCQTPADMPLNKDFNELRISQTVDPGMFVNPFTEVWRILSRD